MRLHKQYRGQHKISGIEKIIILRLAYFTTKIDILFDINISDGRNLFYTQMYHHFQAVLKLTLYWYLRGWPQQLKFPQAALTILSQECEF